VKGRLVWLPEELRVEWLLCTAMNGLRDDLGPSGSAEWRRRHNSPKNRNSKPMFILVSLGLWGLVAQGIID